MGEFLIGCVSGVMAFMIVALIAHGLERSGCEKTLGVEECVYIGKWVAMNGPANAD